MLFRSAKCPCATSACTWRSIRDAIALFVGGGNDAAQRAHRLRQLGRMRRDAAQAQEMAVADRKSVVEGKRVSVGVDFGGPRTNNTKKSNRQYTYVAR